MNDFVAANHERRLKFYYKNYIGIYLSLYKIVSMVLRIVSTLVLNAFVIHVDIFIRFGMMSIAVSCEVSNTILFFNIDGHMYSIPRNIRYMDMLYHCSWYLFRVVYFTATCISTFYCIADDFWVTWMAYMENYFTISCLCRCYQQNHKLHNYVYIFFVWSIRNNTTTNAY